MMNKSCFQKKINPSIKLSEDKDGNHSKNSEETNDLDLTNDGMLEFIKNSMLIAKKDE